MTIIQHRDCGDEQEKKERVFNGTLRWDDHGMFYEFEFADHNGYEIDLLEPISCKLIVEEP